MIHIYDEAAQLRKEIKYVNELHEKYFRKNRTLASNQRREKCSAFNPERIGESMTEKSQPGLGSGALREALAELFELVESGELVRDISRDGQSDWHMRMLKMTLTLKKAQEALSLSSPIEPREMTDFERKEIIRLASHPNNGETVAEYVETLLPAQASSEIRELLLRHGFVRVFCGFDGEFYYACKQCNAYSPGHNHVEVTPELAKHNEDCKLAAALAPSRQGAAKRVEG